MTSSIHGFTICILMHANLYFFVQKKKATKMSAHLNNSQHGSEMGKVLSLL